jgi:hypothetical protein
LKIVNEMFTQAGVTNGTIYVDITARMDAVIHE